MVKLCAIIKSLKFSRYFVMAYFTGEYFHQLDAKNRIRIPAKLRKELGEGFYFAYGSNHSISVFTKEQMERILENLGATRLSDLEAQKRVRMFSRTCVQAEEDNQGRIVLSAEFRKHALIDKDDKDLVICGAVNRVEIWNRKVYEEYIAKAESDFDAEYSQLDI